MRDLIRIQAPSAEQDAAGQPIGGWTDVATVSADMRFPSGAETIRNGLTASVVHASARIRTRAGVDNTMRLDHKGVAYDIKSVLPDSKDRRFMFIVCEAAK